MKNITKYICIYKKLGHEKINELLTVPFLPQRVDTGERYRYSSKWRHFATPCKFAFSKEGK